MTDAARLLDAYDDQLRTDAEAADAVSMRQLGPLYLLVFAGGTGLVTYRDLDGLTAGAIRRLISEALSHYARMSDVSEVEWKTRGHDRAPGLHEALLAHDFVPGGTEAVMLGSAQLLAGDAPVPRGVTLRSVTSEGDIRATVAMHAEVYGRPPSPENARALFDRLSHHEGSAVWVAEADGLIISSGRLEPVANSDFAGLWGGVTRPEWRRRGVYRALTAQRARAALRAGKTYVHSDSTGYSQPILERSGLIAVSTTTPYLWQR